MDRPSDSSTTIAAVATPAGTGGLAVVRVSGSEALDVARRVCDHDGLREDVDSHRALVGIVRHPAVGEPLDQVVLLPMLGPNSYTGEDVVEFSCHGGDQPAGLVLEACLAAGATMAAPGEFTRRAFLNGRMSLDQAEAVADLIHAEDSLAARAALSQLRGGLRRELVSLEEPLLGLLARLEGGLEFVEDEDVGPSGDEVVDEIDTALVAIDALLDDASRGRRIRDGVQVVLAGRPNAGKSSLFNALLGEGRALVDHEAGTTRDVVSARLVLEGVAFVLHDTAGLRDDAGRVESAGVERARSEVARADLVLWVQPLDGEQGSPDPFDGPLLKVGSRSDLATTEAPGLEVDVVTSSHTGEGLDELRRLMLDAVEAEAMMGVARAGRALSHRHHDRLSAARVGLDEVRSHAASGVGDEVLATLLASVLTQLGEVTGRVYSERVLGEVFSRFCVGK